MVSLNSLLDHAENVSGRTPHHFCARFSGVPSTGPCPRMVSTIFDLMLSVEPGQFIPHVMFDAISTHDFLVNLIHPIMKFLFGNLHHLLTVCQRSVLSTAEVGIYERTKILANYHTLPKQSYSKHSRSSLQISDQRPIHGHIGCSTVHRRRSVHVRCINAPSLLL